MAKPSDKPLSQIDPNFMLHSDRRAEERQEYDMARKNKEAELDGAKRQMEERRRHEEEMEIQRLRREAIHKAQPVRNYKGIQIHPSDKPVTEPMSPRFTYQERSKRQKAMAVSTIPASEDEEQLQENQNDTFNI